jgi:hypothetical protein
LDWQANLKPPSFRLVSDLPHPRARLLEENYPSVASDLLRPLLTVFTAARDVCEGDVDKFLILLAVGMRTSQHPEFKALGHTQILSGETPVLPSLGTNIRSIAASVGVPKESTRRKLAELVEAGWLVRLGWDFRMSASGYAALEPVRAQIRALAMANHDLLATRFPD